MYPTYIYLGAAITAVLSNIVLVLAALTKAVSLIRAAQSKRFMLTDKQVRQMTKVGNTTTMVISAMCLALWVAVTAYYGTWDTSETSWDLL